MPRPLTDQHGATAAPKPLVDRFGQVHTDLRLSLTDRCDLRRTYRMPAEGLAWRPKGELLDAGVPRGGRVRDALGPLLPSWLRGLGAEVIGRHRVADRLAELWEAVAHSPADIVITTGSTAAGPVDFLHETLRLLHAPLIVDSVSVRPGHPMLLARLPATADGRARHLVGLPGNPLAAVAGTATLAAPLLRALGGHADPEPRGAVTAGALPGHPRDTRLLPVRTAGTGVAPLPYDGPAMLRGLALADALAVVPPGGVAAGDAVELLPLPTG